LKIDIQGLGKTYCLSRGREHHVFSNINLTVEPGSMLVILGASGCGKSTLLNIIAGLRESSCGTIRADGEIVDGPSPLRNLLFQNPSLLPWLTVAENISFGCQVRGDKQNLANRVSNLIEMIGLTTFANAYPAELSVGMVQRVCLAIALLANPKLLLLDEPFSSLDTFKRHALQQEVVKIWQQRKLTTIVVTHDIDEGIMLGQRIVLLGGAPCTIKKIYDIKLPYPRDPKNHDFFELRNSIIEELKNNYVET
jgi:ABC-type nitrate/sulfonate/bicarbonate transport system ATPase subunit